MNKKLENVLRNANRQLKENHIFENYRILIGGNFTGKYNEVYLEFDGKMFPIANAETEGEAMAIITAYLVGLKHGEANSYVRYCDKN